jgi:hypothetical protein
MAGQGSKYVVDANMLKSRGQQGERLRFPAKQIS